MLFSVIFRSFIYFLYHSQQITNTDHFVCAKPCNSLGVILKKRKKWKESTDILSRALKLRELNLGN
jgi:hypothetical protein